MSLPPLPPGTILQHIYLKERLRLIGPGRFVEVGCGQGITSKILLDLGWTGIGYDLNPQSLERARLLNKAAVEIGDYQVVNQNWLDSETTAPVDLVISCMVLEHLNDSDEERYFQQCRQWLKPDGKVILLVPASPAYWGIEDEIAGHYRRYSLEEMPQKLSKFGYRENHLVALTYPVSNLLYPLSEFLVARAEKRKTALSMLERTRQSGNRKVFFKTHFPSILKIVLNEVVMYPFHLLQKIHKNNAKALVMYLEATLL
ncbi:MAG: hypothetical protein BWK78_03940 [Thiotrichaceae bacterium IS1]|nr:MAG: hypothetical protein BWK78_03940 [Thiotrichaceae bacterium IS1]